MLVLSRKKNESVVIGEGPDAIKVMLVEIRGDKVRLGFECPRHIPVNREEIYLRIQGEQSRGEGAA